MSIFDWFQKKQVPEVRTLENPAVPLSAANIESALSDMVPNAAGVTVSLQTCIQQSVVWTCVRVLAETMASLPLQVFQREGDSKKVARDHPLYSVLHDAPNTALTSYMFRETWIAQTVMYGNGYALIVRDGKDVRLLLILPSLVTPRVRPDGLFYEIRYDQNRVETVPASDILHIPGLSLDGINGISLALKAGRDTIALAMAAEEHSSRFFSNGARVGGVLSTDQVLGDVAFARLKDSWTTRQSGLANAYKTAVLEQGLKYQAIGMQSDHAQLVETRRLQTSLIAGLFRIPPIFVGDYSQAHYANAENSDLHLAKHTISPWCSKIEQELNKKLFADDPDYFCEFNLDGLLRGDFQTRMEGFAKGVQAGIFTPNEVRGYFNLPKMEGGDSLFIQQNMASAKAMEKADPNATQPAPADPAARGDVHVHIEPRHMVLEQAPDIHVAAPVVHVAAPTVNVPAPVVHVAAPVVNVEAAKPDQPTRTDKIIERDEETGEIVRVIEKHSYAKLDL